MYCEKCGNPLNGNSNFCSNCGASTKASANVKSEAGKYRTVIVILLICLTACLTYFITNKDNNTINVIVESSTNATTQNNVIQTTKNTTATLAPTTEATTTKIHTTEKPTEPKPTKRPVYVYPTTTRAAVQKNDRYDIRADGYFMIKNTPDKAGLSVRSTDSSSSTRLEIAGEGTVVRAINDYSSLDNGYVYVETSSGVRGWVLADYLYAYNPYSGSYSYNNFIKGVKVRVSYNTPSHAGLNMRSAPTSSSEKLTLVSEGAVLDVLMNYSSNESDYIYVGYDHPHAGTYYTGWVLVKYLEYYGV